jgi:glutamate--cysteine ligase
MSDEQVRDVDQLAEVFREAEKPPAAFRIGMEAEKFGVHKDTFAPLGYQGDAGVEGVFRFLTERFGYTPSSEVQGGPPIALKRGHASVTLEPAAQVELSGEPHTDLHGVFAEYEEHLAELCAVGEAFGLRFLHVGFHPLANHSQLSWVPKRRYPIMAEYLPRVGARGLDMMRRTATVQANLDYASEADAMRKLRILSRLAPVIGCFTMNAPFIEGRVSSLRSERQDVWRKMDPRRSGALVHLWEKPTLTYRDYTEWALDAGMFLFYRGETQFNNTGQTFRDFMQNGFKGERATLADWKLHLGTLFPEVRLKTTLELRCCDCLPPTLAVSIPALSVGLTADERALAEAEELSLCVPTSSAATLVDVAQSLGLRAPVGETTLGVLAARLLDVARGGLKRRAVPNAAVFDGAPDESVYLDSLTALIAKGQTPADSLLGEYRASGLSVAQFVTRQCCVRRDV